MKELHHIHTDFRDDVFRITLNRPERGNAINLQMIDQLANAFDEIENNSSVRIVLLKANGNSFCSGADLNWMANSVNLSKEENIYECRKLANLYSRISDCAKICIAQVQGPCIGGGIGLIAACDYVMAATESYFSFSEVKLGLIPATVAPYAINRMGWHKTRLFMLSGSRISADLANQINLVDAVCSKDLLEHEVDGFINELRSGEKNAQQKIKLLLKKLKNNTENDDLIELTAKTLSDVRVSDEAREGIHAFLNKKIPDWKNS